MRSTQDQIQNRRALRVAIAREQEECTEETLDIKLVERDGSADLSYDNRRDRTVRLIKGVAKGSYVPFLLNLCEIVSRYADDAVYLAADRIMFETTTYGEAHTLSAKTVDRQWQRWKLKVQRTGLGLKAARPIMSTAWAHGNEFSDGVRMVIIIEPGLIRDVTDDILLQRGPKTVSEVEARRDKAALARLRRQA